MDREEILKLLSNHDLTEEEREYLYLQLYFTGELNSQADEQILEFHKEQKENRDSILSEIAKIMLSYQIVESIMSISNSDKLKLKNQLNALIQTKIQSEVNYETLKTKEVLKSIGTDKYNINNYINDIGINVKWDIKPVEEKVLDKIINTKVESKLWDDRIWDNKNDLQKDLKIEINNFLNGKTTVNEIEEKIKKKYNENAYETKRLVHTEVARVQEEINQVWAKENGVKYQLFMATLDYKTSQICRSLDGKVFEFSDINKPIPPLHPFCRSTLVNMSNKDWRPSQRIDNVTKERISWQTYEDWLKENNIQAMNLQLFGFNEERELQKLIDQGLINENDYARCSKYFSEQFSKGIKSPIGTIYDNKNRFVHIARRHHEMISEQQIDNIVDSIRNPDKIYKTIDKFGNIGDGYVKNINNKELLTIVRNDIITAYYPSKNYMKKIKEGELIWERR